MPTKLQAIEVIPDKFWITYHPDGSKSGTLRIGSDTSHVNYTWLASGADPVMLSESDVDAMFAFVAKDNSRAPNISKNVFDYPIPNIATYKTQMKDNLPVFTKSIASKIYHCAGYYAIEYPNNGWTDSFCPKISTLRKYTWLGPFKTETDMQIAIQRKNRE